MYIYRAYVCILLAPNDIVVFSNELSDEIYLW